jgi:hypothetical protein
MVLDGDCAADSASYLKCYTDPQDTQALVEATIIDERSVRNASAT